MTYDKQSGVDLVLDGTMRGYPEPEYKWYFGSSNTTLATTALLTVSQVKQLHQLQDPMTSGTNIF